MTKNQKNKKKQPKEKDKFQWWTGHTIEKIIDISFPPFECHLKKFPEKIPTHTQRALFFCSFCNLANPKTGPPGPEIHSTIRAK